MSEFNVSIIPSSGLSLIASATATSPLIIDSVIGCSTSYTDTQIESACNTPSFFAKVKDGEVDSASIANNIARIVVGFAPNDSQEQELHTIIITAHTATVNNCVLCAVSDAEHSLHVFSKESNIIHQRSELAFSIAVNDGATITTPTFALAQYLTHTETERFVTTHKAGSQTEGDDQIIYGNKTYNDDVVIAGWFMPTNTIASGYVACTYVDTQDVRTNKVTVKSDGVISGTTYAIGSYDEQVPLANITFTGGETYGEIEIKTGNNPNDGSRILLNRVSSEDNITLASDQIVLSSIVVRPQHGLCLLGTDTNPFAMVITRGVKAQDITTDEITAKTINGVLPAPKNTDGNITCPVGAIVVAHIKRSVGNKNVGDTFTVEGTGNDANAVYTENTGTNFIPKYGVGLPEGAEFRLLTGLNFSASDAIQSVYALVMRIA